MTYELSNVHLGVVMYWCSTWCAQNVNRSLCNIEIGAGRFFGDVGLDHVGAVYYLLQVCVT